MLYIHAALARLHRAFPERSRPGRVSRARALTFCAIVFGAALPLAFCMCLAMMHHQRSRPAEILSVYPGSTPSSSRVSYRSRGGELLTREFKSSRTLRDALGREVCLSRFANGASAYGALADALKTNPSALACSPSP